MDKFPRQIKYIVGNEAAERFSYYGMKSILTVFMTTSLLMLEPEAKSTYHFFGSAVYLLPLLGAFISDRFWGKYKTIMTLSVVYCAGHAVLAIWENRMGLYFGLGLIALGSGGIKPCVSAHVGDQFTKSNKHLVQKVFELFYWLINFGAFFSTLLIPYTLSHYGSHWAFGIPGILMAVATFVFWMGKKYYVHVPPTGKSGGGFLSIVLEAFEQRKIKKAPKFLDNALGKYDEKTVEGARAVVRIIKVFVTVSIFWSLFEQTGSSWVLQAEKMDLMFMGMKIDPSQLQAWNPLMVMGLIPLFSYVIYPLVERMGIKLTPLRKMATGMYVAAASFLLVGGLQLVLDHGGKPNAMWQFFPYLVLTAAEVLVSITGLEFAYTQAPRAVKSTIMSFWLLTVSIGNLLTAYISKINVFQGASYFFFFMFLMLVVSFLFTYAATKYQVQDYIEGGN